MTTSKYVLLSWFIFHSVLFVLAVSMVFAVSIMTRQSEYVLQHAYYDTFKMAFQHVEDRASVLVRANVSAHDIAKALNFDENTTKALNLSHKVGPRLFKAFTKFPSVTEISYIGFDGSIFSYYRGRSNNAYVLFSEISNSSDASSPYKWYRGLINESTGDLYDNKVSLTQERCNYSKWLHDGVILWGVGCGNVHDPMILFAAPVAEIGVILLGVGVKSFAHNTLNLNLWNAYMYLGTNAGHFIGQTGPPHTHFVPGNNTVSVQVMNQDDTILMHEYANYSCQNDDFESFSTSPSLEIWGKNYKLACSNLDFSGFRMILVLAFGYERITSPLYKLKIIIGSLMGLLILGMVIGTYFLLQFLKRLQSQESLLQANLVKQKEATQQAERKSMNKTLTFASASHDIRTSLAGITGLIELCRSSVADDSEVQINLKQMDRCATKLLGILNSVLDISKVEAGKMQLEEVEFDMAQVLEESINLFHVVAMKKGLEVIWDPCDCSVLKSCTMIGDCNRFKQIIDNLLGNAIKFTFEGHVIIRAWAKKFKLENVEHHNSQDKFHFPHKLGSFFSCFSKNKDKYVPFSVPNSVRGYSNFIELVFEVEDSGIGIPMEKRASVFENYVQVKDEHSEGQVGTGLGLGIVQSYVRLMGGEISIQDKEFAKRGTCFRFNIILKSSGHFQDGPEGDMNSMSPSMRTYGVHSLDSKQNFTLQAMTFRKCPRFEGTHVILLVQGNETNKMLKTWFESLGTIVSRINHLELLSPTLERIRDDFDMPKKVESSPMSSLFNRSRSCRPSKERVDPYHSFRDDAILTLRRTSKKSFSRSNSKSVTCILIVIDLSYGSFAEIDDILKKFDTNMVDIRLKIIWLIGSDIPSSDLKRLKQGSSSLVLHKPCHGSRLCAILKFLQDSKDLLNEEGSEMQAMDIKNVQQCEGQISNKLENEQALENDRIKCDKDNIKPLSGITVLLVEDLPVLQYLTTRKLSGLGATVVTSTNGLEALNLIRKALQETQQDLKPFPYDVVFMDCEMPIMDGYEATKHIREEEKIYGLHIPIIALTAHTAAEEGKKITASGMNFHLTKPPNQESMLEAIRNCCQMPK